MRDAGRRFQERGVVEPGDDQVGGLQGLGRAVFVGDADGERPRPRAAARPAGLSSRTRTEWRRDAEPLDRLRGRSPGRACPATRPRRRARTRTGRQPVTASGAARHTPAATRSPPPAGSDSCAAGGRAGRTGRASGCTAVSISAIESAARTSASRSSTGSSSPAIVLRTCPASTARRPIIARMISGVNALPRARPASRPRPGRTRPRCRTSGRRGRRPRHGSGRAWLARTRIGG